MSQQATLPWACDVSGTGGKGLKPIGRRGRWKGDVLEPFRIRIGRDKHSRWFLEQRLGGVDRLLHEGWETKKEIKKLARTLLVNSDGFVVICDKEALKRLGWKYKPPPTGPGIVAS